jgi:hypothetical protein
VKPVRARAPRGANREAVLAVVRDRPGVTTSELAAASGVTGGTLYALLRRLTDQGELAKRELPGGQTGYALASGEVAVGGRAHGPGQTRMRDAGTVGDDQTTTPAASPEDAAKTEGSS